MTDHVITSTPIPETSPNRSEDGDNLPAGPVVAVIPAFNEDRFIASVILKTRQHVDVVIVVDDGSQDDSVVLAEQCGAKVIRQPQNQGKAAALNVGLAAAREMGACCVILIDADGQQNPHDIPAMIAPIRQGEADVVVGSRFMGTASSTPIWRVMGQQALTAATNLASGVNLTDSQSGFRALSRKALEAFNFQTLGFSVESEMQFLMKRHQLVAREVPIVVNYDEKPKRNPIKHGLQVLNGIYQMVSLHRPLFFFGAVGGMLLLFGLYVGLRMVEAYNADPNPKLAVGTALIAVGACILGALFISTGIILNAIRIYLAKR